MLEDMIVKVEAKVIKRSSSTLLFTGDLKGNPNALDGSRIRSAALRAESPERSRPA